MKISSLIALGILAVANSAHGEFMPTTIIQDPLFNAGTFPADLDGSLLTADGFIPAGGTNFSSWTVAGSGVGYGSFSGSPDVYFGVEVGDDIGNGSIQQVFGGLDPSLSYFLFGSFAALEADNQGLTFSVTGNQSGTIYTSFSLLDHGGPIGGDISFSPAVSNVSNANGTGSRSTFDFAINPDGTDSTYTLDISATDPADTSSRNEVAWLRAVQLTSASRVPEPSSFLLLAVSSLGLLLHRKR